VVVGRIAAVAVVITVGVVVGVHRSHVVEVSRRIATRRRRQDGTVAVIVEAVGVRAVVVARTRTDVDDHPGLVAVAVPVEAHRLEVLKDREAVEFVPQFIVGHHRIDPRGIRAIGRDGDGHPLDSTGADTDPFLGIVVTVVRIQVYEDVASVGVIADVLHIVVDRDRIGVVGQHGL
jgi:hypothetical protein